ncbi:MAG: 30S ribosomal protein S21 [Bacteroidetes bacterium]|nr:MAG: 30S ribosomal protein S21 [Bacteroidota bacterium]
MLKIERKEGETIDRMLKRYKRKHRDTKIRKQLSDRKQYTKPSVKRRKEILKAAYIEKKRQDT